MDVSATIVEAADEPAVEADSRQVSDKGDPHVHGAVNLNDHVKPTGHQVCGAVLDQRFVRVTYAMIGCFFSKSVLPATAVS